MANKGKAKKTNKARGNYKQTPNYKKNGRENSDAGYGGNDLSWYNRNPELLDAAAKIPFAYQPGREVRYDAPLAYGSRLHAIDTEQVVYDYPGLMFLEFYPSVGRSMRLDSPINIAAREVYAKIRSKYSGSLEADAPDIMMYMLALDSMYMFIEDLKRAYYLLNMYSPHNLLYPRTVVDNLGFEWEDLYYQRNAFYQAICEFILKANRFLVPDRMDLFKRHQFMCANIYADSAETKSQHYAFRLKGLYKLDGIDTGTKLTLKVIRPNAGTRLTLDDIYQIFDELHDAIASWDTAYTINGYFERAYEGEQFLASSLPIYDGVLNPVFNPEVLLQIQNCTAIPVDPTSLDVVHYASKGNLIESDPFVGDSAHTWCTALVPRDHLLSIPTSIQPDAGAITIATRLTATVADETEDGIVHVDCGTEVVSTIYIVSGQNTSGGHVVPDNAGNLMYTSSAYLFGEASDHTIYTSHLSNVLKTLSLLSAFRFHPTFTLGWNTSAEDVSTNANPYTGSFSVFCDADNVTSIQSEDLTNIHRVCIYSEFNCFH